MKRNAVRLLVVVFAILALVIGANCFVRSSRTGRFADGVAPTPKPEPMAVSVAAGFSGAYVADGVAPTPKPEPMTVPIAAGSSGAYVADGVAPTPKPEPMLC